MASQYYTPQRYFPSPQQPSPSSSSRLGPAAAPPSFTPAMRDRQARGKDPYSPHDSPSDSDMDFDAVDSPSARGSGMGRLGHLAGGGSGVSAAAAGESFEDVRQRQFAIGILDDPEKLAMYACSRGDSIPGTRLYFTRLLCGLSADHPPQKDHRKATATSSSSSSRRHDSRRRSGGGERVGRH